MLTSLPPGVYGVISIATSATFGREYQTIIREHRNVTDAIALRYAPEQPSGRAGFPPMFHRSS